MNEELQIAIDALVGSAAPSALRKAREGLSKTYSAGRNSRSIFENEPGRLSYLAARMPATYGAAHAVLSQLPVSPATWLDLGAGPGTASWAAASLFPESRFFVLMEKSEQAIATGKQLAIGHPLLKNGEWICASLPQSLPAADIAILSYSLGELERSFEMIDRWWHAEIPFLVVVEPGTPRGFSIIKNTRDQILGLGGFLIAPCPHSRACPLKPNDWCHFSVRISRTRLHRYLKTGSLGYEDEKYSYLIASKRALGLPKACRILRHPQKQSGNVRLTLCTSSGNSEDVTISRSHQEFYRKARDASWGGLWEIIRSSNC